MFILHNKKMRAKKAPQLLQFESEHHLQKACVRWFDVQYPAIKGLLFAIPNGGDRHPATGKKLKAEGVRSGVPDLFLSMPRMRCHGLYIEMKQPRQYQSPEQKEYETILTGQGYAYEVCKSLESFMLIVNHYIKSIPHGR
jgi:hypothetical protein